MLTPGIHSEHLASLIDRKPMWKVNMSLPYTFTPMIIQCVFCIVYGHNNRASYPFSWLFLLCSVLVWNLPCASSRIDVLLSTNGTLFLLAILQLVSFASFYVAWNRAVTFAWWQTYYFTHRVLYGNCFGVV